MKKLVCLLLVALSLFSVCACSCFVSDVKYDYEDMTQFIRLPDYKNHLFEIEEDSIKQAIGTYLMQFSSEYTVQAGDKVKVDIKFFEKIAEDVDKPSKNEIKELAITGEWIEKVGLVYSDGKHQLSSTIENNIIGMKNGDTISKPVKLDDDYYIESGRGRSVFAEITVKNIVCEEGDVVLASYTGYYLDKDGNIVKENGKDKTFDQSDNSSFYIGSNLAIKDFENGLIGMTIGEENDIYATFPEDYAPDKNLAGQKVLFKVKIKSMYTPPIYNNAFVQKYFSTFKTTKEFEEALKKEYLLTLIYDYINNNAQVIEYPEPEYEAANDQLEEIAETWTQNYSMTLDAYIMSTYGMTRDAYIKSNMKTEMIFYSLRNMIGTPAIPTEVEIAAMRSKLIEDYKNQYMQEDGLTDSAALSAANEFVDALGETYVYEQVMYEKIDDIIPTQVQTKMIESEREYVFDAKTE